MVEIAEQSYKLAKQKFSGAFETLDRIIKSELPLTKDPHDDEFFLEEIVLNNKDWEKEEAKA